MRGRVALLILLCTAAPAQDQIPEPTQATNVAFRLYRTQNIYTLLKLDTRTGRVWQVQWSSDEKSRGTFDVNPADLTAAPSIGRFTLYPTLNMFTFILLDQIDGRQWQVQWHSQAEKRFIAPIPETVSEMVSRIFGSQKPVEEKKAGK